MEKLTNFKNYVYSVSEKKLEIRMSKKKIISASVNYCLIISVALYFILSFIYHKDELSNLQKAVIAFLISLPILFFTRKLIETKILIEKISESISLDEYKIKIPDILGIEVRRIVSAEVVSNLMNVSLKTKTGDYTVLSAVEENDLGELIRVIIDFIGIKRDSVQYV